ncbi:monovalent cation:proton antiporter family protein [Paraburkholderia caballeronis]|uniref:Kef-type potassium/proton antiporter, CPA2 family n=1 Tax=Paraburkholderia caballeronis TaxID=416943 RepID=A0A1H7I144_9BURK|nr:monovalent cation:proton antiporter family protein [Paraburkholderia caballeronis]PXW29311.1 Kef-type potassium/proton antiporter (CPA2 family) [Paraburkholderia caballeronis]PXX04570.1 Kef-type potassium/proton antiporter (CPA2 family) [Paraburkholderia caballeronis]RAK05631.1 Kef-type potassium/proton antiporter (CPA2 family) [Paraburkholderia caballeronis]TDV18410.1 Kef-type potassium/proton antiporter (CPA2 family) [Paraburkholderia caballeronis]TDV20052.1 Kef-type potassium/proton anti
MISPLEMTLFLLLASVVGVVLFRSLNLPPMLGYLTVGILVGPRALGIVGDPQGAQHLAEFGVVFLMFSIGLEFSLAKLRAMQRAVFGLGLLQVLGTIAVALLVGFVLEPWVHITWQACVALGGALAMSSTAIVSKMLAERLEIESEHGRNIFGVLLFQDLAVVPLLIIIAAFGGDSKSLVSALGFAAVKIVFALALLLIVGQKFMTRWFNVVARRRSQELFVLNVLLVTLGAAFITDRFGLSLALGAFIAGMLIAETPYRHQVEEDIKPFRDVLLGLFFVTTGMLLDPHVIWQHPLMVFAFLVGPVVLKAVMITALTRVFGASPGVAMRTGLGLAQAGEFGFVLLNLILDKHLVDPTLLQAILAAMLLSMLAAPFLIQNADRIVLRLSSTEWMQQSLQMTRIATQSLKQSGHVIICGYGRSGQNLARMLENEGLSYVALDLDPDRVSAAAAAGESVVFGDAARRESLVAAGIHRAAAVAITYANTQSALRVLHHVHELEPTLPVTVRTVDDADLERLLEAGATEVIPEIVEGSLMLASHMLVLMGVPMRRVVRRVEEMRDARYSLLRGYFHGTDDAGDDGRDQVRLQSVPVDPRADAVGRTLADLGLYDLGVEVTAIRRHGIRGVEPDPETKLREGDIVVLRGLPEQLAQAEERLLRHRRGATAGAGAAAA